jgi:Holliday junction resolvase RusA-like endonuclease
MGPRISFTVLGTPAPQGSMRAIISKNTGKAFLKSDNPNTHPFRQEVGWSALRARVDAGFNTIPFPGDAPVSIMARFYFARPKSAPKNRKFPVVKPDQDKLLRACCDALKGVLWTDDCQVVRATISKDYHETPHALITVEECLE